MGVAKVDINFMNYSTKNKKEKKTRLPKEKTQKSV